MASLRNVYACLVHERLDCVVDLVRNLRYFDRVSPILLYDGGTDSALLKSFPFDRYGAVVHPSPQPAHWGRLHGFALDCMAFALQHTPFDTLTIVDSDQVAARSGYTSCLERCLADHPRAGVLGNSVSFVQPVDAPVPAAVAAFREIELWRPFLRRFRNGEDQFVRWCFWPSTVFTADAARELTALFAHDVQLREIMSRTQIWATEEVIFPTVVALAGLDAVTSPCSYDFVKYRTTYSAADGAVALGRPDVFWIHPVPRRYDDELRAFLRERHVDYRIGADTPHPRTMNEPLLVRTLPVLAAMRNVEGWFEEDEADLLLAAAVRSLDGSTSRAIVEVGSYCGRSTIILGQAVYATRAATKVYAIDPHDGYVGALDQGVQYCGPTFEHFQQNIAHAGLSEIVESIQLRSVDVRWEQPIGLLLIDGLYDYFNVARDFYHFERWIEPGGYVAFHGYADFYPGVKTFVGELLSGGDFEVVDSVRSLIIVRRTAAHAVDPEPRRKVAAIRAACPQRADPEPAVVVSTRPLVSCIMPTADRAEFVPQAIAYFLRQDYPDRELIVIDDGPESVAPLIPHHPRIRYVRCDERRTMGAKHNLGCELARGEIICHWDDDDWNADGRISYQVQELLQCPAMTLSGLSHILYYEPTTDKAAQYIYPANERPWVGGCTLCYRKQFWQRHKFPDMNEGADTIFVWSLVDAHVQTLTDPTFFVAIIHSRNTSPKRTQGFGWHKCNAQDVRALLKHDCSFYDRWRV